MPLNKETDINVLFRVKIKKNIEYKNELID